ncbi:Ankyrin repeats (3 copies) [compost metagenome]
MLEALLDAGADPDARWDNGSTMLMRAQDAEIARILIRHGADPTARTPDGTTPLHSVASPEVARVLVEAGADINALASPEGRKSETDPVYTPLQASLILGGVRGVDAARTLLELGADPMKRDGEGLPTLAYALNVPAFQLMEPYGFDPLERMPDGGTLLHRCYRLNGALRANFPQEIATLDLLLSRGIDINAVDDAGQTVLHIAAPVAFDAASLVLLLERGAQKDLRDHSGKRPVDLVSRSKKDIRDVLE